MKTYDIFKEYIWLVQTIHRHRKISLEEINELWRETDMSGGIDFNRTTFSRHKDAIQDIFGLFIECDRKNGYKYYIGNDHVLDNHRKALFGVLTDERLYDRKGLTRACCSDNPSRAERETGVMVKALIISYIKIRKMADVLILFPYIQR